MRKIIINKKIRFLCLVKPSNTGFTGIGPSASHGPYFQGLRLLPYAK